MNLLATYTLDDHDRFDIHLTDIETHEALNVIAHSDGSDQDLPLIDIARAWAERHGHTIAEIDYTHLRS